MKERLFSAGCFRHLFSKLSKKKTHQGSHVKTGGASKPNPNLEGGGGFIRSPFSAIKDILYLIIKREALVIFFLLSSFFFLPLSCFLFSIPFYFFLFLSFFLLFSSSLSSLFILSIIFSLSFFLLSFALFLSLVLSRSFFLPTPDPYPKPDLDPNPNPDTIPIPIKNPFAKLDFSNPYYARVTLYNLTSLG
jgi:hypothetical protein